MLAISSSSVDGTFGFIVAFGAGMLSFLSPCVLPLVPGYLSMMTGLSSTEMQELTPGQRVRLVRVSLLFVAGFTVVFVALGASASELGRFFSDHRQFMNRLAGVIIIVMGLTLIGWVKFRPLMANKKFHVDPGRFGVFTAPIMGMAFAFGWTPCIGAVLTPILALASNQDTVYKGMWLLFFYSMGLGVPFLLCSLAMARVTSTFAFFKRHFAAINFISGGLLVVFGFLIFTSNLTRISNWLVENFNGLTKLT